jgi:hypothetical protein
MKTIKILFMTVLFGAITLLYAQTRVSELIKLKDSDVSDDVLIAYIQSSPKWSALTADDIVALKDAGISDAVIAQALRRSVNSSGQNTAANVSPAQEEPAPAPPAQENVDQTVFEEALNPYGNWVIIDGVRYWRPGVAVNNPDWAPYMTNGHWVYTDLGWTWVSDYPWGWAPFHYGRWHRHAVFGWVWWPDVTWGPAWVRWRTGDDFCGWAPLPPFSLFVPHHGFFFRGNFVDDDFEFGLAADDFFFVPSAHFCDNDVWGRRVDFHHRHDAFKRTVYVRNNFTYVNSRIVNHGPSIDFVSRVTRTTIRPMVVETRDIDRPGPHFRGVTVSPGRLVFDRPRVRIIAPPRPPLFPPLPLPPGVTVMERTHQERSVAEEPRGRFQPNRHAIEAPRGRFQPGHPEKSPVPQQRPQRSESIRPSDGQKGDQNVTRERRTRNSGLGR